MAHPPANHREANCPPAISLADADVVEKVFRACSSWGCFVAVDNGLDPHLLQQVLSLGHKFFDLDEATKAKYNLKNFSTKWRGYMPRGGERSVGGTLTDQKEGFYMGDEHPATHPRVLQNVPTYGSNVFPAEVPEMKEVFLKHNQAMKQLGDKMMSILSLGLGLDPDYLEYNVTMHEPVILPRMFRYFPLG